MPTMKILAARMDFKRIISVIFLAMLTGPFLTSQRGMAADTGLTGDTVVNPDISTPDPNFPIDPIDQSMGIDYSSGYSPFPLTMTNRRGSLFDIARTLLYETLTFYGVAHIAKASNYRIKYQGLASKYGYFEDLDDNMVNQAINEFIRFFHAHLCNIGTAENFFKAFNQLPLSGSSGLNERLALRFKNDFAWALLGNALPREPNQIMLLNSQWNLLRQLLTSPLLGRDVGVVVAGVTSILNFGKTLNRVNCMVDIRPNPRDEIHKRTGIRQMLEMKRYLNYQYGPYEKILSDFKAAGKKFMDARNPPEEIKGTTNSVPVRIKPASPSQ